MTNSAWFGSSVAVIGDLDGDGVDDLAVGARYDDDGGTDRGAVWILFMTAQGIVSSYQKISDTSSSGLAADLASSDYFGWSVAAIGDLDEDGVPDLVVGAQRDDDGGTDRGAVYVLYMEADGLVASDRKISSTSGGFTGVLDNSDYFGSSVASIGDLDSNGVMDIAVGAYLDDDGGGDRGALWVLFMNADGTVASHQKISSLSGAFGGALDSSDWFGWSVANIGDVDADGVADLAVGSMLDDDGGTDRGAVYVLYMEADGTVASHRKISNTVGLFTAVLDNSDWFGSSVSGVGDVNSDGVLDMLVGSMYDDDFTTNTGAMYVLFMSADGSVSSFDKISSTSAPFTLDGSDYFGSSVASSGVVGSDGYLSLWVGATTDDDGGTDRGSVYMMSYQTVGLEGVFLSCHACAVILCSGHK